MKLDVEYEVFKYLNQQAEEYESLPELLEKHGMSFAEAWEQVAAFQEQFLTLCRSHAIGTDHFIQTCFDLMQQIETHPEDPEIQYLYLCIMTDIGLLNGINSFDRTEEQMVLNYFRQQESLQELSAFLRLNIKNANQLHSFRAYLKKSMVTGYMDCTDELHSLFQLLEQHDFAMENAVLRDNLTALVMHLNLDQTLKSAKPYIIAAVLCRKRGMMQNRENYLPNIDSVFQYQEYNILHDNGKNFNTYHEAVELYAHIRLAYSDEPEIDLDFCDFCFANLSRLSEWYYTQCKPDHDIPMTVFRKLCQQKPASFPMLYCYDDFADFDFHAFVKRHQKLYRKWERAVSVDLMMSFLAALCYGWDRTAYAAKLPDAENYAAFAEFFLYEESEAYLKKRMLDCADYFINRS